MKADAHAENMAEMLETIAELLRHGMPCHVAIQAILPNEDGAQLYAAERMTDDDSSRLLVVGMMTQRLQVLAAGVGQTLSATPPKQHQ